jgi:hypothetical protein
MSRPTRTSKALDKGLNRSAGIRSFSPKIDFGDGLNISAYEARVQDLQTQLYEYNTKIAELDARAAKIAAAEEALNTFSEKMLSSVANRYGKTSLEYGMAGGTVRKSGRARKATATATAETAAITTLAATNGKGKAVVLN